MELRRLGKTGHNATILTLGGFGVGKLSQKEADNAIQLAMQHGVNMIDVAPSYDDAEVRLKPWIKKHRTRFFLAEKTMERTKKKAWKELKQSQRRLGTNHFDLYQFHAVGTMDELKKIFGKNGAIEAFKEAKETGLIKYIGITGHSDLRVLLKAFELFDFDTVLAPINLASMTNLKPVNNFKSLLKMAVDRDVGVIAIKAVSRRRWIGERRYGTWYEPVDDQKEIDMALWFTLSQAGVVTYSMAGDVRLWSAVLDAAERYRKLSEKEQEKFIKYAREHRFKPLFPPSKID